MKTGEVVINPPDFKILYRRQVPHSVHELDLRRRGEQYAVVFCGYSDGRVICKIVFMGSFEQAKRVWILYWNSLFREQKG